MSYEGDYAPLVMPAFTRATGIKVAVQSVPWTAAHAKLLTAHAGNVLPDVFMLPNGWVSEFAMLGALAEIGDASLLADLFPGTAEATRYAGQSWAVPWAVAPQVQYYRRDLIQTAGYDMPPTRWDEWKRMGHAIRRRNPDGYAVLMLLNWFDQLFAFAGQMPGRLLKENDTRGNFSTPEFREALGFYKSIFDEGLAPKALSTEVPDPYTALATGWIAIYPAGPVALKDLARRAAEIPPARWATQQMPGPDGPGHLSGLNSSIVVSRHAAADPRAWALVRYLTAPATELRFLKLIGALPARASAWSVPALSSDPNITPFARQLQRPSLPPNIVEWERIQLDVQLVAERVVRGLIDIGAATRQIDDHVDKLLAKRRWLVERGRIA